MSGVIYCNAILIPQDINSGEAVCRQRRLLRGAGEQIKQNFSYVRD
jgi:hypothetical protein